MARNSRAARIAVLSLAVAFSSAVLALSLGTADPAKAGNNVQQQATPAISLSATPGQVEGPYFLPNSPVRSNLIPAGMTGQAITISGQVLDTSGNALANATVHIWVADPSGKYDNQDAQGNPLRIPLSKQTLRGRQITGSGGTYTFDMLRPGNYSLGNGQVRPAHIHVKVEAAGYKTLITQLYFVDDQFNLKDLPGPGFFQPELLVPLSAVSTQPNAAQSGTFNFVLTK